MKYYIMLHMDGRRSYRVAEDFLRAVVGNQGQLSYPTDEHKEEGVICLTCPEENDDLIDQITRHDPEIVIQDGESAYIGVNDCTIGFHIS